MRDPTWSISENASAQPTAPKFSTGNGVSSSNMSSGFESSAGNYKQVTDGTYQYPRAGLGRRSFAFFIDYLIAHLLTFAAILMVEIYIGFAPVNGTPWFLIVVLAIGLWSIIYPLVRDGFANGQSWGKKMCGLMVVDFKENQPCTTKKSALRNLFWLVVPYFILIEIIVVIVHEKRLRLGDMAAKTQVIDVDKYHSRQ